MIISKPQRDFLIIDEDWIQYNKNLPIHRKVHIVQLAFEDPTEDKIEFVLDKFKRTNRFIITDNIRFYNYYFKQTRKKYYVENPKDDNFITFLRKNNKILINFETLNSIKDLVEKQLEDLLRNTEVIKINKEILYKYEEIFETWSGNAIVMDM